MLSPKQQVQYEEWLSTLPNVAVATLMLEAVRRYATFHYKQPCGKSLEEYWCGLGTATAYDPAVHSGYMIAVHEPNPNHDCWWRLTSKGVDSLNTLFGNVPVKKFRDDTEGVNSMFELAGAFR